MFLNDLASSFQSYGPKGLSETAINNHQIAAALIYCCCFVLCVFVQFIARQGAAENTSHRQEKTFWLRTMTKQTKRKDSQR